MNKPSTSIIHIFGQEFIFRYMHKLKFLCDNGCGFLRDFAYLLNYFLVKTVCTIVLNDKDNSVVGWGHQLIYSVLVTKYLINKVFKYINP